MFTPNKKHTIEHLRELKDEVKELHPILNVLFRKLPGIERVHYNQGANELGADFILYRSDTALLRTTCVGVVVKADSIRQNTTEVERQIKECFIPRKGPDGLDVQIREVWVVSSQDITKNARDVIGKLYSDRKVEFIAAQDLAGLIDKYAPDAFVTTSPALQEYAEAALASLAAEDQRSLLVPGMEVFYVEPRIVRRDFDGYGNPKSFRALQSLGDLCKSLRDAQLSVIQAGAGGGKSRLARELARKILEESDFSDGKIVPYVAHSRDFLGKPDLALEEAISKIRKDIKTEAEVLMFLDGFDELDLTDDQRAKFVDNLIRAACANKAHLVLLSRPFDEVSVLGSRVQSLDVFQIEPLKGARALAFLNKVAGHLDVKSKLVNDLNKSILLRALDGAPIAYILLGRLIAENQQDLPSNLTELFQKYSELVLGRWEIAKGLRSQKEYEVLVESLVWLSVYMMDNELYEIGRIEIEKWISTYCAERGINIDAAELVNRACSRSSILYLRSDVGVIGFRHRAFCEFFYAKHLSRMRSLELSPDSFSPYWINSYYFLAGLQRDCPDLINSMVDLPLDDEPHRLMRVLNFGNLLLAGYLTPTKVCTDALKKIAFEASNVFLEICDQRSNSQLSELPTLQVLCFITTCFHAQYGYRHFKDALEEAVFDVESDGVSEKSAVALFLLDAAYKEAGGELRFDQLIEKFGDSLPLSVKLAIGHEAERMKVVSDRMKKLDKYLRRSFSGPGSQEFLRKLYQVPIKKLPLATNNK